MSRTVYYAGSVITATLAIMCGARHADAQGVDRRPKAYLEILGNGLLYSANVEQPVGTRATVRVGAGGLWLEGISYVLGVGMAGWELITGKHVVHVSAGIGVIHFDKAFFLEGNPATTGYGTAAVAYRYQPRPRGVFFQVSFTPGLTEGTLFPWGGAAAGIAF